VSTAAPPPQNTSSVPNTILLTASQGAVAAGEPYQFGRVFRRGEVAQCPVVSVNGVRIPAQVDPKNRYPDGSLKFAVVSALLPAIASGAQATLALSGSEPCNPVPGAGVPALVATYPGLDAQILVNGAMTPASLKAMIAARKYSSWIDGPIATTLVVADHIDKAYDFGTDANRSLRPVYHVTHWKASGRVTLRVIVEQSDTQKMQSQEYGVEIRAGLQSPQPVYSKADVKQGYATRWTKVFELGGTPRAFDTNHNMPYLSSTMAFPNFDASVKLSAAAKTRMLQRWANVSAADKDIGGGGMYLKYMPGSGGRAEIGLLTDWAVFTLFDGDARLWQMLKENSYLAGSFPVHFREGDPQRVFMRQPSTVPGVGRVATRDGRKRMFLYDGNGYWGRFGVTAIDEPIAVGVRSDYSWIPDCSHQPDDHFPLYITTGDPWFLEQLQFWASWGIFSQNASYDQGPKGPWNVEDAWFDNQGRGEAWCLRTRARAAWSSPDSSAENIYFNRITNSALRAFEGMKLGPGNGDPTRAALAANYFQSPNALFAWKSVANNTTKPDTVEVTQSWTQAFIVMVLGHITELGFDANQLRRWAGQFHVTMATTPGIDPHHLADYSTPTKPANGGGAFFVSWQAAFADWPGWTSGWSQMQVDLNHGYPNIINAALSFTTTDPGGSAAWQWVWNNNYSTRAWSENPKWAILPRP
jgi:hypothetical protein